MKIKFEYNNKTHVLSPSTGSIEELKKGVMSRYPNSFKWGLALANIKNNAVYEYDSWEQIVQEQKKMVGKSLKIQVLEKSQQLFIQQENIRIQNENLNQNVDINKIKKSQLFSQQDLNIQPQKIINLQGKIIQKSQNIEQDSETQQDLKLKLQQELQYTISWITKQSLATNFKGDTKQLALLFRQMSIDNKTPRELIQDIVSNLN